MSQREIPLATNLEKPTDLCVQPGRSSPDTSFIGKFNYQQLPGIEHDVYYRSLTIGETIIAKANQGFANIGNLTPGDTYYIWVVASKEGVESEPCKLEDPIQTYPGKVEGLTTDKMSPTSEIISWKPVFGADSYLVKKKRFDGNYETIPTLDTELTLSNLDRGQTYKVCVAAVNSAGTSELSDSISFTTGMMPPSGLEVSNNPDNPSTSINCTLIQPQNKPSFYHALAITVSGQHRSKIQKIDTNFCMARICGLLPGVQYVVQAWSVYEEDEKLNSEKVLSTKIWTSPCKISNIQVCKDSTNSQIITWNKVPGATSYNVQLKKKGIAPVTYSTTANNIHFGDLELNCQYSVSVTALNPGGFGEKSEFFLFETALRPVKSVLMENSQKNPTTELIVRLEGSEASSTTKYKLRLFNIKEGTVEEIIKSGNIIRMNELHECTKYKVGVTSVHETDEELDSEEILSDPIWTLPPSLSGETMSISHDEQKFMWNKIVNVSEYRFHWRVEHKTWQQETVNQDEFIWENLEPGKKYEVYVTAINDSGEGEKSPIVQFVTVPAVPTDLQQQILSTQEVKISCKSCEGADGYIFKINNISYVSEIPEFTLQCENQVNLEVTVQSYNDAGESELSEVLKFRQVVRLLQQNFKQMAENFLNRNMFVTPKLIQVPSGDVIEDLGLLATQTKEGGTIMLMGEIFTGKTACCSYFLQHVPNAKLAFFLNYEEVKTLKTKFNVKSILHKYMFNLSNEEMDFFFHWMKNNSNQVVFIVDNFSLSPEFKPQHLLYENEGLPNQIFYNLLVTNRQVFPKSQVFCSTSHDSVKQFLNPTLSLNIDGFDGTRILNMKKNILGEKSDIADLPEVFQFFCAIPGFCKSSLYMIKNNKIEADLDSFSSILVQIFLKSISRYPLVQKKVKINHLWQKINEVPKRIEAANINPEKVKKRKDRSNSQSQVATSVMESSINSGGLSFLEYEERSVVSRKPSINCDVLQDYITIAMYFAFFCKLDDFKKRLRKKSLKFGSFAKIWIMIAGLLRKETMKAAKKIFEPADIVIDEREVLNKCEIVKKFIKDNIGNILNQIYIEPQITLNWFSICNELNDGKLLQMCKTKIEILDKSTIDEVEKASEFLRRLPKKFCSNVKVKYACNDATKTLSIDNAIRENPNGNLILMKSKDSSSILSLKRHSSKYQSHPHSENLRSVSMSSIYSVDKSNKSNTEPIGEASKDTSTIVSQSDYSTLHAREGISKLPVDVGLPIKFINIEDSHSFQGYIKLSKVFTTPKSLHSELEKVSCTIPVFCTSVKKTVIATIVQSEKDKWKNIGAVQISRQQFVHCELDAGETYAIVLPSDASTRNVLFHFTCQIYPVGHSQIISEVSMNDGVETITRSPVSHQRFTMKMGETVDIMVKKSENVIFDWKYNLDPENINISKTLKCHEIAVKGQEQKSDTITCSIVSATTVISHITFNEWSKQQYLPSGKKSRIVENIPESSIWVQLVNESPRNMKVVAKSLSSGHEIATTSTGSSAVINGIDPGDKYSVSIFDMSDGHYHKLISKTDIQTSKTIGEGGDIVRAGNCTLIFPERAVKNGTKIEISDCAESVPTFPDEYFCITPIMDFRSSQKKFDEPVICKLTLPHIIVKKTISVDVMCFEDNKWDKVCSSVLTENSAVEFRCDHFSPYTLAIIIQLPYSLIPNISFWMHNMVYFDKNDNFMCVTCLDYESIKQKCKTTLMEANYIPSPLIIPTFELTFDKTAGFFLKCLGVEPERLIGEWQTTLNYDFVKEWSHMQDFQMDKVVGQDRITLLFSRLLDDSPRPVEKKTQVSYPLDKNAITSTEPSSAAVNAIQGQGIKVINYNPVLHGH
ncbi:uncharacterized protein LOC120338101 [Styela clava]